MPYKRNNNTKKTYTKRSMPTANYIAKIAKSVTNKEKPTREARFALDNSVTTFHTNVLANAFKYSVLNAIAQGNQPNERTGDRIYISGAKVNFMCANAHTSPRALRVMCVANQNRNGDLLDLSTFTDLFTSYAESDRTADNKSGDIVHPINEIAKIYFDKVFLIPPDSSGGAGVHKTIWIPIRRTVVYDNLGTSAVTISNGSLYLIFHLCEPDDTLSATISGFHCLTRVFYKDA